MLDVECGGERGWGYVCIVLVVVLYYYSGLYSCADVRERVLVKGVGGLLADFLSVKVVCPLGPPNLLSIKPLYPPGLPS